MRTIDTITADGITIRLVEREASPRYVIVASVPSTSGFVAVADDSLIAKAKFERLTKYGLED